MLFRRSCAILSLDMDSPVWLFSKLLSTPITSVAGAVSVVAGAGFAVGVADVDAGVVLSAMFAIDQ